LEILRKPDSTRTDFAELDAIVFRPAYSLDAVEDEAMLGYSDDDLFSPTDVHRRIMQSTRRNYALGEKIRIFVTSNGFHPEVYCTVTPARSASANKRKRDRQLIAEAYHDDVVAAAAVVKRSVTTTKKAKHAEASTPSAGVEASDSDEEDAPGTEKAVKGGPSYSRSF
jgi:hypothetical protein